MAVASRLVAVALALALGAACAQKRGEPILRASDESSPRIVSLAPSLTEIAYAVGCGDKLVADTSYDDYPAGARALPHVADLVTVDLERLSALHATTVLALHDQERQGSPIETRLHVSVVYLPNRNLRDLFADIARVGEVCRSSQQAQELSRRLHERIAAVAARAARAADRPRVFFLLDLPGFTAGSQSYIDDLIRLAGGVNAAGNIRQAYPNVSAESLVAMDPQILIVARGVQMGSGVLLQPPWRDISAVREGRILRPPSDDIIERNGPRIVDGLEWLESAIHPGR